MAGPGGHAVAVPRSYGWGGGYHGPAYRPSYGHYYPGYGHGHYYPSYGHYYGGYHYRPYYYGYPYYAFHSHFSIGFGLYVGWPVPFPYTYSYPYPVPYPYPYPYSYPAPYGPYGNAYPQQYPQGQYYPQDQYPQGQYPQGQYQQDQGQYQQGYNQPQGGSMMVTPGRTGGLSFDIQPSTADVFVDGQYYGPVSNYTPRSQPLALSPGRHRVEIRAQGYQDMTFDADVTAGQVTPFQGTLSN